MTVEPLSHVTWQSHLRAVLAIARKDLLLIARYPLNALFRILQPLIWLTPLYFLGRSFSTPDGAVGFAAYAGTADFASFILVGTLLSGYISAVFWGMGYALKEEMDRGVLEANWLAPVPRPLLLAGRTPANLLITTLNGIVVLLLAWLLFGFQVAGNVLAALAVAVPMIVALYGFGFALAALVLLMRDANTLIDIADFVVGLFSGSQFPVRALPPSLLVVSLLLPLTYGFDAVRGLLLNTSTLLPLAAEVAILLAFMLVMLGLGALVFERVERRCRDLGTLGLH